MDKEHLEYALAKQLKTIESMNTRYGEIPLDEEMAVAVAKALSPIIEARIVELQDEE